MAGFGIILLILGAPLYLYNLIAEKKNPTWQRLGGVLSIIGLLIILLAIATT